MHEAKVDADAIFSLIFKFIVIHKKNREREGRHLSSVPQTNKRKLDTLRRDFLLLVN